MKTALLTIAIGDLYQNLARITHGSLRQYAKKIGADFVVIDQIKVSQTSPHFEKFQIFDLLNKYERILYIDTDIIVREDCPNLFDIVPPKMFGAFNEGAIMSRFEAMQQVCRDYETPLKKWEGEYYNTGVMVLSRVHKPIFKPPVKEIYNFYEQSYLNLKLFKDEVRIQPLHYTFNRMSCMDSKTGEHRLKSYIVHYAGVLRHLDSLIPSDLSRWQKGEHHQLKNHILIGSGNNRLGDNVAIEPVVRYIIDNQPNTRFTVAAVWPEVFRHLEDRASVISFEDIKMEPDVPVLTINLAVDEENPVKKLITCDTMHMLDFTSIMALHRVLPNHQKQIQLTATPKGIDEIRAVYDGNLKELILVHPGRAWPSKTFPKPYWDEVIASLIKQGQKVAIIGADTYIGEGKPCHGTVDVDVPDGAIDFRNLLSVEGLISLVSLAKTLVTNDSGPLHVAGAFDNNLVLIASCKHPDLVLPWRHGDQRYKTKALLKRLTSDAFPFDASTMKMNIEEVKGKIEDFLPTPAEVVEAVISFECPKTPTAPASAAQSSAQ